MNFGEFFFWVFTIIDRPMISPSIIHLDHKQFQSQSYLSSVAHSYSYDGNIKRFENYEELQNHSCDVKEFGRGGLKEGNEFKSSSAAKLFSIHLNDEEVVNCFGNDLSIHILSKKSREEESFSDIGNRQKFTCLANLADAMSSIQGCKTNATCRKLFTFPKIISAATSKRGFLFVVDSDFNCLVLTSKNELSLKNGFSVDKFRLVDTSASGKKAFQNRNCGIKDIPISVEVLFAGDAEQSFLSTIFSHRYIHCHPLNT